MATFLDVGLLRYFNIIFPFLLVWALVFALLQKTKLVGSDRIGINAIIALAFAFMVSLSDSAVQIINFMIPWFTIAIIFFLLIILIFQIFGAKEENIFAYIQKDKGIGWIIIGIVLIIAGAAFTNVFGQDLLSQAGGETSVNVTGEGVATPDFQRNIYATLFHPKVLGIIILFTIAIFAIALLSQG